MPDRFYPSIMTPFRTLDPGKVDDAIRRLYDLVYKAGTGSGGTVNHYVTNNNTYITGAVPAINVKDAPYLAVGDGITDDTVAVQTAINDARTSGKALFFPEGTYLITSTLNFTENTATGFNLGLTVYGVGIGASILQINTTDAVGIDLSGAAYVHWQDIRLNGGTSPGDPPDVLMLMSAVNDGSFLFSGIMTFDNVMFAAYGSFGTYILGAEQISFTNCQWPKIAQTAVCISKVNTAGVTSSFQTLNDPASSMTAVSFSGFQTTLAAVGDQVVLLDVGDSAIASISFTDVFGSTAAGTAFVRDNGQPGSQIDRISLQNVKVEGSSSLIMEISAETVNSIFATGTFSSTGGAPDTEFVFGNPITNAHIDWNVNDAGPGPGAALTTPGAAASLFKFTTDLSKIQVSGAGSQYYTAMGTDGTFVAGMSSGSYGTQVFRLNEFFNSDTDFSRINFVSGSVAQIYQEHAGTGVTRPLQLGIDSNVQWEIETSNKNFRPIATTVLDIGDSSHKVKDLHVQTIYDDSRVPSIKDTIYGAVGDGIVDDTVAIQTAINDNSTLRFPTGTYKVSQITFSAGKNYTIYFDGAIIIGGASTPTNCVIKIESANSVFHNLSVDVNFNSNYANAVWWYNASVASQFNNFFGFTIKHAVRGLVYGALPGNASTSLAQSENTIVGFSTRGVQNPFYNNHLNGGLYFIAPQFVANNEDWISGFDWTAARAFESAVESLITIIGGELIKSESALGYAAEIAGGTKFIGTAIETACPLKVIAGGLNTEGPNFTSVRFLMTRDDQPQFYIATAVVGSLSLDGCTFIRPEGLGAYSAEPIVNASAANTAFEVRITDGSSNEWRWAEGSSTLPVRGGRARYRDFRVHVTAADSNVYWFNNLNNLQVGGFAPSFAANVPIQVLTPTGQDATMVLETPDGDGRNAAILWRGAGSNASWLAVTNRSDFTGAAGNFAFRNLGTATNVLTLKPTGIVQLNAYGAGTLATDASGNITVTSDARITTGTLVPDERPATPIINDLFISTDFNHIYRWTGSAWSWIDGGGRFVGFFASAPGTGWHLADGTAGITASKSDGTTETITVPNMTGATIPRGNSSYSGPTATSAVAPTSVGHTHGFGTLFGQAPGGSDRHGAADGSDFNASGSNHQTPISGSTGTTTVLINADGTPKLMDFLPYFRL